jgi:hypothetical protein
MHRPASCDAPRPCADLAHFAANEIYHVAPSEMRMFLIQVMAEWKPFRLKVKFVNLAMERSA